nr:serine/threonine-protein kinase mos-like [Pocillopora verrucosa]XP_058967193.1 serine/threonine-protein kinase mos-like [Pocillopora verrucosa]XP_058967194.1 serine/threonine-protein kinase mos-like [Pocillopora verrucosa]XP_058967195.1 serine/threonine-protein kinase mos-like [Pocillopora verrucosa]
MLASDNLSLIRSRSMETMVSQCKAFVREIEILSDDEAALVQVSKLLGSGGFGSVYEGKYLGKTVAVKKMNTNSKNPRAVLQSFQAETSIASFCHPHIVRTLAASSLDCPLSERVIVMEFAGPRTLRNILDNEKEDINEERRMKFASHITMALEFIHAQDIAHLDVKPANILVDSKDICKLGDFGCSQVLDEGDENLPASPTYSYLTGTFAYRAPELLKGEPPTPKADIYSLGICLWQLLTREQPYGSENLYVVVFGVVAYNLRPRVPSGDATSCHYQQLVESLWQATPCLRPTANDTKKILRSLHRHPSAI